MATIRNENEKKWELVIISCNNRRSIINGIAYYNVWECDNGFFFLLFNMFFFAFDAVYFRVYLNKYLCKEDKIYNFWLEVVFFFRYIFFFQGKIKKTFSSFCFCLLRYYMFGLNVAYVGFVYVIMRADWEKWTLRHTVVIIMTWFFFCVIF